ncbi:hypothetical protein CVCC1112_1476 [Paenarthrobacter nicotinovorans]|nr:hypothetical protein CVCC1112_1476 [Paenarthrobacter nicotinovorans]
MERPADFQRDGVHAAAFVSELDPLAHTERPATPRSARRLRGGACGCLVRACAGLGGGGFAAHVVFLALVRLGRDVLLAGGARHNGFFALTTGM